MQGLSSIVYYLDGSEPKSITFEGDAVTTLGPALQKVQELRNLGYRHVVLSTENSMSVGKPGVDVVGPDYNWKKRRQ